MNEVSDALEKLQAIVQKYEGKTLLNYGELRELTSAQSELLIALCKQLQIATQ